MRLELAGGNGRIHAVLSGRDLSVGTNAHFSLVGDRRNNVSKRIRESSAATAIPEAATWFNDLEPGEHEVCVQVGLMTERKKITI